MVGIGTTLWAVVGHPFDDATRVLNIIQSRIYIFRSVQPNIINECKKKQNYKDVFEINKRGGPPKNRYHKRPRTKNLTPNEVSCNPIIHSSTPFYRNTKLMSTINIRYSITSNTKL